MSAPLTVDIIMLWIQEALAFPRPLHGFQPKMCLLSNETCLIVSTANRTLSLRERGSQTGVWDPARVLESLPAGPQQTMSIEIE